MPMKLNIPGKIFNKIILFTAIVVYTITAYNSNGFYHADEHYQLIEFAGIKTGSNTPEDLTWEYHQEMRPALQPVICFLIFKALNAVGINDPYHLTFGLRLISGILTILVMSYFIKQVENWFQENFLKNAFSVLSYFLWFIPFLGVRFSSETWSGIMFLLSLAIYNNPGKSFSKIIYIGVSLGLSFFFRFQAALLILGFVLWLIFIQKEKLIYFTRLALGFSLLLISGIILDTWFYGSLVFTPWNYLNNTILHGGTTGFGTSSWYYYFQKLIELPGIFIGIILLFALAINIFKFPKDIFVWSVVPFIIVHCILPHKEERFLFPIVFLFPFLIIRSYQIIKPLLSKHKLVKIIYYILGIVAILFNLIGLVAMAQKSAGIGRMAVTSYIHNHYKKEKTNLISCRWANPYNPWQSLPMKFYKEKELVYKHIDNLCELNDSLIIEDAINLLTIRKADLENKECLVFLEKYNFRCEIQSIPLWQEKINSVYKGFENYDIIILYKKVK